MNCPNHPACGGSEHCQICYIMGGVRFRRLDEPLPRGPFVDWLPDETGEPDWSPQDQALLVETQVRQYAGSFSMGEVTARVFDRADAELRELYSQGGGD